MKCNVRGWLRAVPIGIALWLWLAVSAPAPAQELSVTATAGAPTPASVPGWDSTVASLSATANWANPGEQPEAQAVWRWSVVGKETNMESLAYNAPWEAGDCTAAISNVVSIEGEGQEPDASTATLTASAPAGYWRITCKARVEYDGGTWEAEGLVKVKFTSVGVKRIIVDGSNPEDQGPAYIRLGASITLRAKPEPSDIAFPGDNPVWTIQSKPDESELAPPQPGASAPITPDAPGTYVFTATCGASSKSFTLKVVHMKVEAKHKPSSNWSEASIYIAAGDRGLGAAPSPIEPGAVP
jgi:hypothetical protein